jgi:hypothetical protein
MTGENAQTFKFNFKGFIIGNGVANWKYDTIPAFIESAFWHGLYDFDLYSRIKSSGCQKEFEYLSFHAEDLTPPCQELFLEFEYYVQGINVYDVYGICFYENDTMPVEKPKSFSKYKSQLLADVEERIETDSKLKKKLTTQADYTPWANLN